MLNVTLISGYKVKSSVCVCGVIWLEQKGKTKIYVSCWIIIELLGVFKQENIRTRAQNTKPLLLTLVYKLEEANKT
jgi:hypothetical protein